MNIPDRYVITNRPGRFLAAAHYKASPPLATVIRDHESLRAVTRLVLTPVVFGVRHPLAVVLIIAIVTSLLRLRKRSA